MKIGQYLAKVWTRVQCLPFFTCCVYLCHHEYMLKVTDILISIYQYIVTDKLYTIYLYIVGDASED